MSRMRHALRYLYDCWKDVLLGTLLGLVTLPFVLYGVRSCTGLDLPVKLSMADSRPAVTTWLAAYHGEPPR